MHKLFFDCETGGTDPNLHSLLTAYFGVYDQDLKLIDDLYLELKPENESDIFVTEEAMKVNKINLNDHLKNPNTVTYEEGKKRLLELLNRNKIPRKRKHFTPAGHNVQFDKNFIFKQLISQQEFEKLVHYRTIDTSQICSFLKDVGIFPDYVGSLGSLVEYFNLPMRNAHNAKDDIEMNVEVYREIVRTMKTFKQQKASETNAKIDLLKIIEM